MNILIKLMSIVSLVIAPYIAVSNSDGAAMGKCGHEQAACCEKGATTATTCDMEKCKTMTAEECAAYCDKMGCSAEQKDACSVPLACLTTLVRSRRFGMRYHSLSSAWTVSDSVINVSTSSSPIT